MDREINKHKLILNYIQYMFPLSPHPYTEMAMQLGIDRRDFIKTLNMLYRGGIIKRIGFTLNYRVYGVISCLVAMKIKTNNIKGFSERLRQLSAVKHNYLRDHDKYNVWFTIRGSSDREIINIVRSLADEYGIEEYIILKSMQTYKLSVKYDLSNGISRSDIIPKVWIPSNLQDYGLDHRIVSLLRRLPIKMNPYREIADRYGYSEDELVSIIREMILDGIIMDYGGILDGEKLGFKYNCMVVFKGDDTDCRKLVDIAREATHIVLRKTIYGDWDKNIYFMIHAKDRQSVENQITRIMEELGIDDYLRIYSRIKLKD